MFIRIVHIRYLPLRSQAPPHPASTHTQAGVMVSYHPTNLAITTYLNNRDCVEFRYTKLGGIVLFGIIVTVV